MCVSHSPEPLGVTFSGAGVMDMTGGAGVMDMSGGAGVMDMNQSPCFSRHGCCCLLCADMSGSGEVVDASAWQWYPRRGRP